MRVIIDTNVLIISLIGKSTPKLADLLVERKFVLLFSDELYSELIEVVKRPKFKKLFTEENVLTLFDLLDSIKEIVAIKSKINICRDKNDNFLLNLAVDGKADFLITEDFDLLDIIKINNTKILKYKQFVALIK
jgi:putative PIN family toxin of toxin-antitoxin system